MRILMLSSMPIFPVNAGDRVRIWQIAQGLAHHAQVTLVLPYDDNSDGTSAHQASGAPYACTHAYPARRSSVLVSQAAMNEAEQTAGLQLVPTAPLTPTPIRKLQSLFSSRPYHVALRYSQQLYRTVESLLAHNTYDLIYCHFLYTIPYVLKAGLPIMLDQHNADRIYWQRKVTAESNHLRQWVIRQNLNKTATFEEKMLPSLAGIISVSEQDRQFMQGYATAFVNHFLVAPNGVDMTHYHPIDAIPDVERPAARRKLTLGFLGSMELTLNQTAVRTLLSEIYPALCRQLPDWDLHVLVVGRQPPAWLRHWASEHDSPHVQVTGEVPDILPYLHQMDLMILPLQSGAGTKLRVLEAMAAGVCIVGTSLAFDGLDEVISGQYAFIAHETQQFVELICRLAIDAALRQTTAQAAYHLVETRYSWSQITTNLAHELKTVYEMSGGASTKIAPKWEK